MTGIAQRILRLRPVRRWNLLQFSSSAGSNSKSPPLSPDIPNSKSEAVKSVFAYLNDFGAYLKGDTKTGNQLNPVSSKGSPKKLGDLMERIKQHFAAETEKEEEKTLQRHDIPGAIDGHTLNDPNEKLDTGKANVKICCECCALFALAEAWIPLQTMNIEETAISIVKVMDEQPGLTLNERFILSQKLMSSPANYAMFKAYKGEIRALFLQSLLKRSTGTF